MKNVLRMKKLFLLICVVIPLINLAQISSGEQSQINRLIPQPVPKSPNVAGLDKFGDYPVSYFTGLPDISIPIFEVKSGELDVPITLSYHASGIKPTDVAGWVGLGWSLSAGGQISRSVQGQPDEQYFYTSSLVQNPSICQNYDYIRNSAQGFSDTQPDVFNYSFPGGGGKFLLGQNGNPPMLIPYAPHIVVPTFATNQFTKFEITNEHGVLHRFGVNSSGVQAREYTFATNGGNPSLTATTSWNLMEMMSPNSNDQISFAYQNTGNVTQYDMSSTITVQDQWGGTTAPNSMVYPTSNSPSTSSVNQLGMSTITYKTGMVEFKLGARTDAGGQLQLLDHINIYNLINGTYTKVKVVQFVYSYFTNAKGGNAGLRLDQLQFKDISNNTIEQYKFTYATNSFSWDGTNPNFNNAKDLWGFYNGATQNTDLIPTQGIPFQGTAGSTSSNINIGGAADRTVHTQYSLEGVLSRIDFPTGGYTTFSYENNVYDNNGVSATAGGLRVTQIQSYDGSGAPPKTKTYKYGSNESGRGVANFSMLQFNYFNTQNYYYTTAACWAGADVTTYRSRTYYSGSSFSYSSYPVMYPYVTEYFGDPATSTIGKIVYEFDNGVPPGDVNIVIPNSGKFFRDNFDWKRGKLTHKTVYDAAGNKLSETAITIYTYNANDNIVGLGAYQYNTNLNPPCTDATVQSCTDSAGDSIMENDFLFTNVTQSTGAIREVQTNEYDYQNGNLNAFLTKQTSKVYETSKYQLSQETTTRGNTNEQEVTINHYPYQFTPTSSSTGNALGIYMLNSKNIVSTPIETYHYLQNSDNTNQRVVSGTITTYRQNATNVNYVVADQIYVWESAVTIPLTSYAPFGVGTSSVLFDPRYNSRINMVMYDNFGNLQTASKTNDVLVSYKYGYSNSVPIAEVKNAQNSQYLTTAQSTGVMTVSFGGPLPGTVQNTYTFTVDYTGTVTLKLGVNGSPTYSTLASYVGISSGSVTLTTGGCGLSTITFPNVSPGTYSLTITLSTTTSGVSSLGACGEIDYPQNIITTASAGATEFFYESFEESSAGGVTTNASLAHCGKNYLAGSYTTAFVVPNSRTYVIEYWYLSGTQWIFVSTPYTGSGMVLNNGTAVDDIRIYPTDAQMKSYTYDPILGMTSAIDESGRVFKYDYDSFGRFFRLRNDNGAVEKQYQYNYKGN